MGELCEFGGKSVRIVGEWADCLKFTKEAQIKRLVVGNLFLNLLIYCLNFWTTAEVSIYCFCIEIFCAQ